MRDMLRDEIVQRRESGHVLTGPASAADTIDAATDAELRARFTELAAAPRTSDWRFEEPSGLEAIESARPPAPQRAPLRLDAGALRARILGAWLGRCAGCVLGKPVENWPREQIRAYLERRGAYPIDDYLPPPGGESPLHPSWPETTRGR